MMSMRFAGKWVSAALGDRSGGNHENPSFLLNPQVPLLQFYVIVDKISYYFN